MVLCKQNCQKSDSTLSELNGNGKVQWGTSIQLGTSAWVAYARGIAAETLPRELWDEMRQTRLARQSAVDARVCRLSRIFRP